VRHSLRIWDLEIHEDSSSWRHLSELCSLEMRWLLCVCMSVCLSVFSVSIFWVESWIYTPLGLDCDRIYVSHIAEVTGTCYYSQLSLIEIEKESCKLFVWAGLELWSSWSLPPEWLGVSHYTWLVRVCLLHEETQIHLLLNGESKLQPANSAFVNQGFEVVCVTNEPIW
jgi:hypothetical protein